LRRIDDDGLLAGSFVLDLGEKRLEAGAVAADVLLGPHLGIDGTSPHIYLVGDSRA
jgi:hypothetical protein